MSTLDVSVGPQHPGSGHFRLKIKLEGDIILSAEPDPGYVHRGMEKSCENRPYIQNMPLVERTILPDTTSILLSYISAIEELIKVTPPERAQYGRVIMLELNRMISHLYWLAIYSVFMGHTTMFLWPIGDREPIIDLLESISGVRLTYTYFMPGGLREDLPADLKERTEKALIYFEKRLVDYDHMFFSNPIFKERTKNVGVLSKDDAIRLGVTGPTLRASGVEFDIRKNAPYAAYKDMDFEIPVLDEGDCYARAMLRVSELHQSIRIVRQALENLPGGDYRVRTHLQSFTGKVPKGEAYSRIEGGRGEYGCYLVSDGSEMPYRARFSTASFRNLAPFPFLLRGCRMADMPLIYWSMDYWPPDADK